MKRGRRAPPEGALAAAAAAALGAAEAEARRRRTPERAVVVPGQRIMVMVRRRRRRGRGDGLRWTRMQRGWMKAAGRPWCAVYVCVHVLWGVARSEGKRSSLCAV